MDEGFTKAFMADPLNFPKTLEDAIDKAETDVVVDKVVQALKAKR